MERTKSCPFRRLPWAGRCRAQSGTSLWPLGARKKRLRVELYFLGVQFGLLVAHGKSRFFEFLVKFWCRRGVPGGVRSGFRRVLSSVWSERNPLLSGECLGPGAVGRSLAPHCGLSGHKKVVFWSDFTFLGSNLEFWWQLEKVDFLRFWSNFGAAGGSPAV